MKKATASAVDETKDYSLSEPEHNTTDNHIKCYDVILSDEQSKKFDELTLKHYKEITEYEKKHRKRC